MAESNIRSWHNLFAATTSTPLFTKWISVSGCLAQKRARPRIMTSLPLLSPVKPSGNVWYLNRTADKIVALCFGR